MVVMTTATEHPEEAGHAYRALFTRLGAREVEAIRVDTRREAAGAEAAKALRRADAVFFTGGDQLRITSILGGTRAYAGAPGRLPAGRADRGHQRRRVRPQQHHDRGRPEQRPGAKVHPQDGAGAGASGAGADRPALRAARPAGAAVCTGVAENPHALGIGIDEDTAIRIDPDACFFVLGSGAVTVIDGATIDGIQRIGACAQ